MRAARRTRSGSIIAAWPPPRPSAAEHKGEHDGVAMAQRSGLYYASSSAAPPGRARAVQGRVLLLQDGDGDRPGRHDLRGVAARVCRQLPRHGLHRVARRRQDLLAADARQPGRLVDQRLPGRWPGDGGGCARAPCTWCGRPCRAAPKARCSTRCRAMAASFSAPVRVPTLGSPKPSHPQIAIDGQGRIVVAWDEVRNGVRGAAFSRMTCAPARRRRSVRSRSLGTERTERLSRAGGRREGPGRGVDVRPARQGDHHRAGDRVTRCCGVRWPGEAALRAA